jgi:hypothetical protein
MSKDRVVVEPVAGPAGEGTAGPCKVLMIFPRFCAESFWNYVDTCKLLNVRYPAAPLGLMTVAALLPAHWDVRLINRNTEELGTDDIAWADLVMTGGMLTQQADTLAVIELCHLWARKGKPQRLESGWALRAEGIQKIPTGSGSLSTVSQRVVTDLLYSELLLD